ncbi:ABC transporter ATP-binding protein [Sphingomonas immobilis]|uniref:ABC transporter ATP-binding protein n=1 Tax=Sphingomonas immobilis TaxID=3063997 RepID=A0ABT8ZTN5_9SPHN|nr:ABC transporter ATP-binding protein [Sphingomonas sp. CA1-15]MDO7840926.1 ABC transporter ATP-binding protein [Sphingomonas sp. CA1-15]
MSSDVAIRAEGLGKKYLIGHETESYTALRDVVSRRARRFGRSVIDMARGRPNVAGDHVEEFWALDHVDFEIARGDVVGIIGRNGAGKSTLLKVLSRITEPSSGRLEIRGRVASLLEVGTGFHPELTGRENIYLNGAILGMSRGEIKRKFDDIVAFAEVDRFLDTPVKRYSSGMYVRLAFSVAAHLEPEILVVDEVLAVGDAEFQKKCLGKMGEVAGQGRTVLFVSHNMGAVRQLCTRGILLAKGKVIADTDADSAIALYSSTVQEAYGISFEARPDKPSITAIRIDEVALRHGSLHVEIDFTAPGPLEIPIGGLVLRSVSGEAVWGSNGRFHQRSGGDGVATGTLICEARDLPIARGQYLVSVWLGDWYEDHDGRLDVLSIQFGDDRVDPLRPPASVIGHVEWPATWSDAQRGPTSKEDNAFTPSA